MTGHIYPALRTLSSKPLTYLSSEQSTENSSSSWVEVSNTLMSLTHTHTKTALCPNQYTRVSSASLLITTYPQFKSWKRAKRRNKHTTYSHHDTPHLIPSLSSIHSSIYLLTISPSHQVHPSSFPLSNKKLSSSSTTNDILVPGHNQSIHFLTEAPSCTNAASQWVNCGST